MMIIDYISAINKFLWDDILIFLLCGTGIFYTIILKGVQIRRFPQIIRGIFTGFAFDDKADQNGMTSFQALSTSIAAQVGTGNLAGTATAIVSGGPGAIFWMWLSAFLGMGTMYAEATLAQVYKSKIDGETVGGPAFYIHKGLNSKKLAICFSLCFIFALGFTGNIVQSHAIASAFQHAFGIDLLITAIVITAIIGLIIQGGLTRIASFTEKVVPTMGAFYILGCLYLLFIRMEHVIPSLKLIFVSAFNPQAVFGGLFGFGIKTAMRYGVARGLFSHEAGMGSTPHAHAVAKVKHPCQQADIAVFGVFFDTFVVLTLTSLVIISSSYYEQMITLEPSSWITSITLTQEVFMSGLDGFGHYFIAITLFFFAITTMIGWYYFAATNVKFLAGKKGIPYFNVAILCCIFGGAFLSVHVVWELADFFNGIMCIPNLLALLALFRVVTRFSNEYEGFFCKSGYLEDSEKFGKEKVKSAET